MIIDEVIQDIGSGLNYNRKNWNQLIGEVMGNKVDTIVITYKDRFIRFEYEKLERKLKREQVRLSRKYESLKKTNKTRQGFTENHLPSLQKNNGSFQSAFIQATGTINKNIRLH